MYVSSPSTLVLFFLLLLSLPFYFPIFLPFWGNDDTTGGALTRALAGQYNRKSTHKYAGSRGSTGSPAKRSKKYVVVVGRIVFGIKAIFNLNLLTYARVHTTNTPAHKQTRNRNIYLCRSYRHRTRSPDALLLLVSPPPPRPQRLTMSTRYSKRYCGGTRARPRNTRSVVRAKEIPNFIQYHCRGDDNAPGQERYRARECASEKETDCSTIE